MNNPISKAYEKALERQNDISTTSILSAIETNYILKSKVIESIPEKRTDALLPDDDERYQEPAWVGYNQAIDDIETALGLKRV